MANRRDGGRCWQHEEKDGDGRDEEKKNGRNTHKRRRGKIQHEEVEKVEAAIIAAAQKEKQK